MRLLVTASGLAKLIMVKPASFLVSQSDVHEKLHAHDCPGNDSVRIDLAAIEVRVGWDLNVCDPPDFDLAEKSDHICETLLEVVWQPLV